MHSSPISTLELIQRASHQVPRLVLILRSPDSPDSPCVRLAPLHR